MRGSSYGDAVMELDSSVGEIIKLLRLLKIDHRVKWHYQEGETADGDTGQF